MGFELEVATSCLGSQGRMTVKALDGGPARHGDLVVTPKVAGLMAMAYIFPMEASYKNSPVYKIHMWCFTIVSVIAQLR